MCHDPCAQGRINRLGPPRLIRLFVEHPRIKIAYFNDERVQKALGSARVKSLMGHNHFHVEPWPSYAS